MKIVKLVKHLEKGGCKRNFTKITQYINTKDILIEYKDSKLSNNLVI